MPDGYRFAHWLTAEAAYHALLGSNRRLLHRAAADALLPRIVPGTAAEQALRLQLLEHLTASQRWEEAHACLRRSAPPILQRC